MTETQGGTKGEGGETPGGHRCRHEHTTDAPRGGSRPDRLRGHRVHDPLRLPRPPHDDSRPGAVLRRHDPDQVRPQHDDDVLRRHGRRRHHLRPLRLLDVLRHREHRRHHRQPVPALRPVRPPGLGRQPVRLRGLRQHPRARLRRVPADLRRHHRRPHQRCGRRPGEVLDVAGLRRAVGDLLLLPDRPHGLGRRSPLRRRGQPVLARVRLDRRSGQRRADRLRRRHGRPHQRRYGRASSWRSSSGSASASARSRCGRTTCR